MKPTSLQDAIKAAAERKKSRIASGEWKEPTVKQVKVTAQDMKNSEKATGGGRGGGMFMPPAPSVDSVLRKEMDMLKKQMMDLQASLTATTSNASSSAQQQQQAVPETTNNNNNKEVEALRDEVQQLKAIIQDLTGLPAEISRLRNDLNHLDEKQQQMNVSELASSLDTQGNGMDVGGFQNLLNCVGEEEEEGKGMDVGGFQGLLSCVTEEEHEDKGMDVGGFQGLLNSVGQEEQEDPTPQPEQNLVNPVEFQDLKLQVQTLRDAMEKISSEHRASTTPLNEKDKSMDVGGFQSLLENCANEEERVMMQGGIGVDPVEFHDLKTHVETLQDAMEQQKKALATSLNSTLCNLETQGATIQEQQEEVVALKRKVKTQGITILEQQEEIEALKKKVMAVTQKAQVSSDQVQETVEKVSVVEGNLAEHSKVDATTIPVETPSHNGNALLTNTTPLAGEAPVTSSKSMLFSPQKELFNLPDEDSESEDSISNSHLFADSYQQAVPMSASKCISMSQSQWLDSSDSSDDIPSRVCELPPIPKNKADHSSSLVSKEKEKEQPQGKNGNSKVKDKKTANADGSDSEQTTSSDDSSAPRKKKISLLPHRTLDLYEHQRKDQTLRKLMKKNSALMSVKKVHGKNLVFFSDRIYIPETLREKSMEFYWKKYHKKQTPIIHLEKNCFWASLSDDWKQFETIKNRRYRSVFS